MKQIKKSQVLIFSLVVLGIAITPFMNFSSSSTLNIGNVLNSISTGEKHVTRLYELILSSGDENGVKLNIDISKNQLNIQNGIVVGDNGSYSKGTLSSIGGGNNNKIEENANYAGIAGGSNNTIDGGGDNSVIGGGVSNTVHGSNVVIAGGNTNSGSSDGVIIGGYGNQASSYGIALGGQNNNARDNSLVMGSGARGKNVFARNANADERSARIEAKSGVLIGTTESIPGVSLVVSGAVKIKGDSLDWNNGVAGEIRVVNGCFYAYDGRYWHSISKSENCEIGTNTGCDFGNVRLQQGDQVTGYNATISSRCVSAKVVCSGNSLVTTPNGLPGYDSPYCYEVN